MSVEVCGLMVLSLGDSVVILAVNLCKFLLDSQVYLIPSLLRLYVNLKVRS